MAIGADPERAVPVLQQRIDRVAGEAVLHGLAGEGSGVVVRQSATARADPQIAITAGYQCPDFISGKFQILRVIDDKVSAVEADQPFFSTGPQEAIGRLGQGERGVLRQPLRGLPVVEN